jgi:cyclase
VLKHRLIPVLLLKDGKLVRSEDFTTHQIIGDPYHEVARFNEWNVDEIVYLDISRGDRYDLGRSDTRSAEMSDPLAILEEVSRTCFMPLCWGGRIRTLDDIRARISRGADKVALCTAAHRTPELITAGAEVFGSQAIVVCLDVKQGTVWVDGATTDTGRDPVEFARDVVARGAGEILLQAVERDGAGEGYDTQLIETVSGAVRVPVVALGGVGRYEHYARGIRAGAAAVAAANIWHFKELSDRGGKRALARAGVAAREIWKG